MSCEESQNLCAYCFQHIFDVLLLTGKISAAIPVNLLNSVPVLCCLTFYIIFCNCCTYLRKKCKWWIYLQTRALTNRNVGISERQTSTTCSLQSSGDGTISAAPFDINIWSHVFSVLMCESNWQAVPLVVCDLREVDMLRRVTEDMLLAVNVIWRSLLSSGRGQRQQRISVQLYSLIPLVYGLSLFTVYCHIHFYFP